MLTIFAALLYEANHRNTRRKVAESKVSPPAKLRSFLPGFLQGNPAAIILVLLSFAVIAMVGTAQSYDPQQCKARVLEIKQLEIKRRIEEVELQRLIREQSKLYEGPDIFGETPPSTGTNAAPTSSGAFGGVFDPNTLSGEEEKKPSNGSFGGVFDPNNLQNQSE